MKGRYTRVPGGHPHINHSPIHELCQCEDRILDGRRDRVPVCKRLSRITSREEPRGCSRNRYIIMISTTAPSIHRFSTKTVYQMVEGTECLCARGFQGLQRRRRKMQAKLFTLRSNSLSKHSR